MSDRIDERLRTLVGEPALPAPDLVDRIMARVPPTSWLDGWNRVALPVALVAAAAAIVLVFLAPTRAPRIDDPIAAITDDVAAAAGDVLAMAER
jgi:hypothetical protein